jgi:hypothetical protein
VSFETFVYFSSGFTAGLVLGFTMTIIAVTAALSSREAIRGEAVKLWTVLAAALIALILIIIGGASR